jgi:hypothetical protein
MLQIYQLDCFNPEMFPDSPSCLKMIRDILKCLCIAFSLLVTIHLFFDRVLELFLGKLDSSRLASHLNAGGNLKLVIIFLRFNFLYSYIDCTDKFR